MFDYPAGREKGKLIIAFMDDIFYQSSNRGYILRVTQLAIKKTKLQS